VVLERITSLEVLCWRIWYSFYWRRDIILFFFWENKGRPIV